MGACRHGETCNRRHDKPIVSHTLLLPHIYQNPKAAIRASGRRPEDAKQDKIRDEFEHMYEDVFTELGKYGEVEELMVADNLNDHMVGETAANALFLFNSPLMNHISLRLLTVLCFARRSCLREVLPRRGCD